LIVLTTHLRIGTLAAVCLGCWLVACADPEPLVVSPAPDSVLRGSWAPVVVQAPMSWREAQSVLLLDGEPLDDPLVAWRRRKNSDKERGMQLLATLPLLDLAPGVHRLEARFELPWRPDRVLVSEFEVAPRAHRVDLLVDDGAGRPVNARVAVWDADGPVALLDPGAWNSDRKRRDMQLSAVLLRDGRAQVRLDPGRYRLVAYRGIRDAVAEVEIDLDGDRLVELSLPRLVETPGVLAADLHVHTASSYDVYTPHALRLDGLACSGLDVVAVADHNQIARLAALEEGLAGSADVPWLIPGIEADMRGRAEKGWDWGHLTIWPVDSAAPPTSLWPKSPAGAVAAWRRRQREHPHPVTGAEAFITLAHPRGIQFRQDAKARRGAWALFNNQGYDREVPVGVGGNAWMLEPAGEAGPSIMDLDALELVNRMSFDRYREVRQDWFALLNQGYRFTGMGNSDSHALAVELVGMPQNLIHGGLDPMGALDLESLLEAARAGRVSVSTGPVLELELRSGEQRAGLGETLIASGEQVQVRVRVRAAPWVPVHQLRLVKDGRVIHSWDLSGLVRAEGQPLDHQEIVELQVGADAWLIAEAGWPVEREPEPLGGAYGVVAPGYVPLAFTNPIRVDADGDGGWSPPGLPAAREVGHGG
jgi:hypothetical protein